VLSRARHIRARFACDAPAPPQAAPEARAESDVVPVTAVPVARMCSPLGLAMN
jgi:hypothetical protein